MTEFIAFVWGIVVTLAFAERFATWVCDQLERAGKSLERAKKYYALSEENYARSLQLNAEATDTWTKIINEKTKRKTQ